MRIRIKIQNETLDMVLMDSLNKRINFLYEVIQDVKLEGINAIHGRAEEAGQNNIYREKFDIAVSRAVAPLNILLEYMLPFVRTNGICICMKGNITQEEINNSKNALNKLGGQIKQIEKFSLAKTENNRTIIIVKKTNQTPKIYPRSPGTPSKKPL